MDDIPPINPKIPWTQIGSMEPVEVDQRALIDKILARYSTQFPVLRELLQNADDAGAKHAFIRFETKAYSEQGSIDDIRGPDLKTNIYRWTIHNDGKPFSPDDWTRVKTIADGNPDEQKIGAFGVGFYSVFSITDNPCIKSGGTMMQFHWGDENQKRLFVTRLTQTSHISAGLNKWTSFELPALKPSPLPGTPTEIAHFLAASLPFMNNLKIITVALDSHPIVRLQKTTEDAIYVPLLNHLRSKTEEGLMTVNAVNKTKVCIKTEEWEYESLPSVNAISDSPSVSRSSSSKSLLLWAAEAAVTVDERTDLGSGLFKSMKKIVPKECRFQLIYRSHDNITNEELIRQRVEAHVHIGYATTQTTGVSGPIAARFIPTVERELIDFVNDHVKTWNKELLYVGGYLARTIYEFEMSVKEYGPLHSTALHALRYFTFHDSTPHAGVSDGIKVAFFGCSKSPLPILSSIGVFPACDVRDFDPISAPFVKKVPMLPSSIATDVTKIVDILKEKHILQPMGFEDLMQELTDGRILTEEEMVSCLKWVAANSSAMKLRPEYIPNFLAAARFSSGGSDQIVLLSSIETFVYKSAIPSDLFLPNHTLPHAISHKVPLEPLAELFLWEELSIIDWLINLKSILRRSWVEDHEFAARVFGLLGDAGTWKSISSDDKNQIRYILEEVECVPTGKGMQRPGNSYLMDKVAHELLELPVVDFGKSSIEEPPREVLIELGINPRVELMLLLKAAEKHTEALQYFVDHYKDYKAGYESADNQRKFSRMRFIPVVGLDGTNRMTTVSKAFSNKRCQVLGFPIIHHNFQADAAKLKVLDHPRPSELISALDQRPPMSHKVATEYFEFLSSLSACHEFTDEDLSQLSSMLFVPVFKSNETVCFVAPVNCYLGEPNNSMYSNLFTFAEFGSRANAFLEACKARRSVEVDDIAKALVDDPVKFLDLAGNKHNYMRELCNIADNRSKVSSETIEKFKTSRVLLGCPYKSYGLRNKSVNVDDMNISFAEALLLPTEVVIIDDAKRYNLFQDVEQLYHAPKLLESFYMELGSQRLSKITSDTYNPIGELTKHELSATVRNQVLQRLPLFIYGLDNPEINERYKWMKDEENFKVKVFRNLKVTTVLDFCGVSTTKVSDTTTGYLWSGSPFVLLLKEGRLDQFDIASYISKLFFERPTTNVCVVLMTLLYTDLDVLRQRGVNVDLIASTMPKPLRIGSFQVVPSSKPEESHQDDPGYTNQMEGQNWLDRFRLNRRQSSSGKQINWDDFDNDFHSLISSETTSSSASSTIVRLRKEKMDNFCGKKYKRQLSHVLPAFGGSLYGMRYSIGFPKESLTQKESAIRCFVNQIIEPLRQVYGYHWKKVQILVDPECHLKAFNQDGTILLNLEHFEREHYDSYNGTVSDLVSALLSWYFTFCHEFSHNSEPTHNAVFEAVNSRACQNYILDLFNLPPLQQAILRHNSS